MYEYHDKGYFSNKTIQYYIHDRLDIIKAMEDVLDHCYNEWKNDSLSYTNIFVKARDYRKHEDYEMKGFFAQKDRKDLEELMQNSLALPWEEDLFPNEKPVTNLSAINQNYIDRFPVFFKKPSLASYTTKLQFRGFSVFLPGFFQFISGEVKKLKATSDNDYIKIYFPIPQEIELKLETKTGEEITHTKVIYSAEMGFLKILKNDFKPVYA